MNLSLKWLHDFTNTDGITVKEYCDRMTDTGSKVEGYEILGEDIENVVVAKVVSMVRHPNSDHMFICQVDIGKDELVQIVTGAQNVKEGDIVPAAIPVAHLPGNITIKPGKLRGEISNGMLCSIAELNLTLHDMPEAIEDGILILGKDFEDKLGMDIKEALMLNDTVVEFEITSNRPDCLSVIGLARETAISFDKPLNIPTPTVKDLGDGDMIDNYLSVKISDPDLCFRYAAKVVKNVKIAPSPLWLRMRLRAAGVRPINNIVDITNYVMLEYGQPMHAFDYSMLDGSAINVRRAKDGELFKSLDDKDHTLDSTMLAICDEKKPCALAGVMGGANSEIKDETKTVVFESACFSGPSVRVTAKKNGMRTESSARFEKGLDPENCMAGLLRACELVQLLGAGDVVDGLIDVYPAKPVPTVLPLEVDKINKFLGVDLDYDYMKSILERLECKVEGNNITVPTFRADLTCMNDIAEEIIRIYGYNKIKSTCIYAETTQGGRTPKQQFEVDSEHLLYGMGYDQIQTFSFISPKNYDKIRMSENDALRNSIVITNPLGEDTSVMRTRALPSMLDVVARNINFSNEDVRLFEVATVYIPNAGDNVLPDENKVITLAAYGKSEDFYSLKGAVENILASAGIEKARFVSFADDKAYHPGRCAKILTADGKELGIFGQIHPLTAQNFDIEIPVYAAELSFDEIWDAADMTVDYKPLPKFPASTRDYSFVCDDALEVGVIEEIMATAGGKLVESVKLFDIYRGPQVGEGKKSVSLRVSMRAADRTLTVEEADKISAKIVKALNEKLGLALRS